MSCHLLSRRIALALLVAMTAGPLGPAAVLHPADDAMCSPVGPAALQGAPAIAQDDAGTGQHTHCAVCHAVRSARWALAATAVPALSSGLALFTPTSLPHPGTDPAPHAGSGRSPPRFLALI